MAIETRSKVEIRAFEIWEREGRPDGKAEEHWNRAVAEIAREEAAAATAKLKKLSTRKKTTGGKKAEKAKPAARAQKKKSASAAKKEPKGQAGKVPAATAAADKKLKKTAK